MATVYSLICWGGLNGKSVSGATSTDILTLTNHGLRVGTKVVAQSTVSGVVAGTTYYAYPIAANTFYLYDTLANAQAGGTTGRIDITATTAFVLKSDLVANPATALSAYGLSDLSRWGSTRIYDSVSAAYTARNTAALQYDDEVVEFGEAFDDIKSSGFSTTGFPGASLRLVSTINGYRSSAFHFGVPAAGYRNIINTSSANAVLCNSSNVETDGIEFSYSGTGNSGTALLSAGSTGFNFLIRNCIFSNLSTGQQPAINIAQATTAYQNIITGFKGTTYGGVYVSNGLGCLIFNNVVTKCDVGMKNAGNQGQYTNNIVVGNTVNYSGSPNFASYRAANNFCEASDKYTMTVTSGTTTANATFATGVSLMVNTMVWLTTTGTLPSVGGVPLSPTKPYYIASQALPNFTLSATLGGGAMTFSDAGTGTHKINIAWGTGSPATEIDFSIPNDVFKDWTNNDFRPAGTGATPNPKALQVDSYVDVYGVNLTTDISGNERPNYNNGGFEAKDAGPFEYDHGYGLHPSSDSRGLAFTGLITGSKVKVFLTGTDTEKFSTASSGTSETWSENVSGSLTVDYVILKAGYLPIRVIGITVTAGPSGVQSTPVSQVVARWYQTASGLTLNTDTFANASTKKFGITVASTVQNLASYLFDQWLALGDTGEAYANKPFPIEANGPNSFTWLDGWEADLSTYPNTISLLSRDGMRYLSTSGVMTASWCALLSAGVPSGIQVRYQQLEGNTPTDAINTGNIDQLIQIYGDATHGSFDYRSYMVAKVQAEGYDQAEVDVVGQYGTLEDQLYVIALYPQSNNVAAGNPTITSVSITDHGASPVTWNGQQFSCTITDSGTTTGLEIMQWIRHAFAVGGLFQGKDGFNWHDLVQKNGTKYKGVRGSIYGDTGAALKGVRVLRGSDPHPDFTVHTADNGSVVDTTPPESAVGSVSDIVAGSRLQVYNVTTATEMYNAVVAGTSYSTSYTNGTGYTAGDVVRVRLTYCSGLTAKLPAEYFTIAASGGWSVLANQEADTVYIDNGIDGSTVTEYNSDYINVQIDISDPDNTTTIQRGYAWYCYQMTLIDGIRYFFGAFIAEDAFNYLLNTDVADIKIQNTGVTGVTLTGGALRRKDGSSPIASGGSVYIYYGRAYSDVVTIAGSSVVTGDLADIAPAVWSHGTRTLTSGGGGGASADDVWNHSKALSVGKFLGLK